MRADFPALPRRAGNRYKIGVMSTVAEQLRQAREAQNLTEQQVVEITKIRTDHLRALEAGNYDVFSAPVYIRGFVRGYAKLLKLDVPQIMAALDAELGQTTKFAEPPPLAERPQTLVDVLTLQLSKVDWRKGLIVVGAIIALVAVISIFVARRHHNPLKGLKPAIYRPAHDASGDTLPLPVPAPRR